MNIPKRTVRLLAIFLVAAHLFAWNEAHAAEGTEITVKAKLSPGKKLMPLCHEAKPGGPEEVVRTLYRIYPFGGREVIENQPRQVLERFFDKRIAELLAENSECETSSGEMCAIESSPMYAAQGGEMEDLLVCEMDTGKHTVKAQFRISGDSRLVIYNLRNTEAGWRISDIVDSMDGQKWSMVDSLSEYYGKLASAWKKAQMPDPVRTSFKEKQMPLPQCERAKAGGPEDVIRALYEQYPWKGDKIVINEPGDVLSRYFDENLTKVIIKHREERRAKGEGLEGMPNIMINRDMSFSQDISGFHICAMDVRTKTARVQFREGGSPVIVTYKLVAKDASWRISDIFYLNLKDHSDLEGPYDWSMLSAFSDAQ